MDSEQYYLIIKQRAEEGGSPLTKRRKRPLTKFGCRYQFFISCCCFCPKTSHTHALVKQFRPSSPPEKGSAQVFFAWTQQKTTHNTTMWSHPNHLMRNCDSRRYAEKIFASRGWGSDEAKNKTKFLWPNSIPLNFLFRSECDCNFWIKIANSRGFYTVRRSSRSVAISIEQPTKAHLELHGSLKHRH